ncbi:CheR family methyltransferase [Brevibacillus laterosporus]|uniref:CheR family methyltransferase n=1 Tax=Brevibacillus laterosporus TaxID=1465 RepID=UPI002655356D|nr:protein-glutamate O-methyltransferase CheR [Brevibacillus laterosporus]MDN9009327.1 protein-glutamate O-methyltransferase CheR [Brevibacillus laterosporus]MDO0940096.1 protein-glutamate O-methyltransferase CheR [Brevibacillus laterosporus]
MTSLTEANEYQIDERESIEIDLLLEGIYRMYGFDYRDYVRSSIRRRIWNRMLQDRIPTVTALLEKVLHDAKFVDKLLNDFSINVTEMFRDPSFFYVFRKKVIPFLHQLPEIRIWHAGCSTGEEAYSMAILIEEENLSHKTKIYATDMNEEVLKRAEKGTFSLKKMQNYTRNYIQAGGKKAFSEYYSTDSEFAILNQSILKNVTFAQHNLVTDCSFNEFHVVICRNVLIYFNTDLQSRVFQLFDESLSTNGFFGLGSKESLSFVKDMNHYQEIEGVRIYQKCK